MPWSVCPHLTHPDSLFDYYLASGSIMLILGKCLCHDCWESIIEKRDLKEFMESCDHLTDRKFQKAFIDPLLQVNEEIIRTERNYMGDKTTQWTWMSCPHVAQEGQLEGLYRSCIPIFFHEGFGTCNDCIKAIPSAEPYMKTLPGFVAMTDDQLQEKVIDRLYPINRGILVDVEHFRK